MSLVNESLGDPARSLRQTLGDALFSAADRLAESGGVLEVRGLQGGQIVTGIVGGDSASAADGAVAGAVPTPSAAATTGAQVSAKPNTRYRVYIRGAQRECSCGVRGGCVHIAAVSIVAARNGGAAQARPAGGAMPAPVSVTAAAGP